MSEFIATLRHSRKLQAAVKVLSVDELNVIARKLHDIIEKRKIQELELLEAEKQKAQTLNDILRQLDEAGIPLEALQKGSKTPKAKTTGKKRPVKYILKNKNGEHPWTGIGRMPRVFADALKKGKSLDKFKV